MIDSLYHSLTINKLNGLVCKKNELSINNLISILTHSPLSYLDKVNGICQNLVLFASKDNLNQNELANLQYESSNCSFNYLKVCTHHKEINEFPPVFRKVKSCQASNFILLLRILHQSCLLIHIFS